MVEIVSGGQTGADRAALDWALERGLQPGGWCPNGRGAEDGVLPPKYHLRETESADPAQRTEWNVRDSDGTVIFSLREELSGGSLLALEKAQEMGKPCLRIWKGMARPAGILRQFVQKHGIQKLNVAGPRESEEAGIGEFVRAGLEGLVDE